MNAPVLQRSILKHHVATIEAKHPIKIIGMLPRGSVGHARQSDTLELLAEKRSGLDLLGLAQAEIDLAELSGRPVAIVLISGLRGDEATLLPRVVEPL